MIAQQLLDILVCPLGKSELRLEGDALVCERCGPRFRISREGYPNMLIEEAELPAGCQHYNQLPCVRQGVAAPGTATETAPRLASRDRFAGFDQVPTDPPNPPGPHSV